MGKIDQEWTGGWNFPEKVFLMFRTPYYVISVFLSFIFILIFEILVKMVPIFDYGYNMFDSIILSILIGFLLIGIQFFLNKMRFTFKEMGYLFENKNLNSEFQIQIKRNFTDTKRYYYLTVLLVILPFLTNQIRAYLLVGIDIFFYGYDSSIWAVILDIYNNLLNYISLYLLAVILWMILNITWALNIINSVPYRNGLNLNLFKADKVGGLRPLRSLVSLFSIYYFILIILFVMSWLIPSNDSYSVLPYESTFLIIFWIIGVAFFLDGWYSIRKLLFRKFEDEINHISDLCQSKTKQLSKIVSNDDMGENEKLLNQISNALDALHKERERILNFGARPMDIKTLIIFLSTSIPSLISILKTLEDVRKMEIFGYITDIFLHIVNQFTYLVAYFFN